MLGTVCQLTSVHMPIPCYLLPTQWLILGNPTRAGLLIEHWKNRSLALTLLLFECCVLRVSVNAINTYVHSKVDITSLVC